MQQDGAHIGASGKSQLRHSLNVYLNNKNRLQPIIGMASVAECVKAGSPNRETLYLCEVCECRLSRPDVRNHIMGSRHRYYYIKAHHPHFVPEWKKGVDLSQLAWPLMEMARILERREGPGDAQVLQLQPAVFQQMASCSDANAIILLSDVKRAQAHPGGESKKPTIQDLKSKVETDRPLPLSQGLEGVALVLPSEKILESVESKVQSEKSDSFLRGYTGIKPLIGLDYVIECRGRDDDFTSCFLCHCCRIRCNEDDIINHLISFSHISNYMMEAYPEQAGVDGDNELQSLAEKVEEEEGRGEPKVMRLPASLCNQLRDNSYHWCIKMLSESDTWTSTVIQKKTSFKGPSVGVLAASEEAIEQSEEMRQSRKRKSGNVVNPVFKVSLPLTKGAMLLERTSFSGDSCHVPLTSSPTASLSTSPSPQPPTLDSDSDFDPLTITVDKWSNLRCTSAKPQHDFFTGDEDGQAEVQNLRKNENHRVSGYQADGNDDYYTESQLGVTAGKQMCEQSFSQNEAESRHIRAPYSHIIQSGYIMFETENTMEERNNTLQHHTQGVNATKTVSNWHREGSHRQDSTPLTDVHQPQDWSNYNSSYEEECCAVNVLQYNSAPQNEQSGRVCKGEGLRETVSCASYQQYYPPQTQQYTHGYAAHPADGTGKCGSVRDMGPCLNVNRSNMNDSTFDGSGIAAGAAMQYFESGLKDCVSSGGMHLFSEYVPAAPQGYMTQSDVCQSFQDAHPVTAEPYYNRFPCRHHQGYLPQPNAGDASMQYQSFMTMFPGQAPGCGSLPDPYPRGDSRGLPAHLAAPPWSQLSAEKNTDHSDNDQLGSSHTQTTNHGQFAFRTQYSYSGDAYS